MDVAIEKKNETNVGAIVKSNEEKSRVTVVTSENFDQYVNEKMGLANPDPEAKAKEEAAKVEAEKAARKAQEGDVEGEEGVADHLPKDKKGKLNERFSKITADRKAAEEKAANEAAARRAAEEKAAKAEAEAAALRQKYEPVKTEPDPEPQLSQFTDVNEYAKALKEWTADNTRREDARKAQEAQALKARQEAAEAWTKRQEAAKKELPDYEKKLTESTVKVSDQVRDAIIDSEVGPQILYHLADHPDEADRIGKMTVAGALRAIGRLEAALTKAEGKEAKETAKTPIAEISKAPAPISPLKANGEPVATVMRGTEEFHGTFEEYKAKRAAGKIK